MDEGQKRAFSTYLDLLKTWNARLDLTAAKTDETMMDLLVTDAQILAEHVAKDARIVDVGSGAGAPGLPLAILRPDLHMTLVEPLGKRTAFLRTVIGSLGRTDVTIVQARGESLEEGTFDEAVSRATLPPAEWLALGLRLVRPQGRVWILLAREDPPAKDPPIDVAYGEEKPRRLVGYARSD
jgi:16S rRNA (guanine527-N7)-methyltransferase